MEGEGGKITEAESWIWEGLGEHPVSPPYHLTGGESGAFVEKINELAFLL